MRDSCLSHVVVRLKDELVNSASEIGSHHSFALGRPQDECDRLSHAFFLAGDGESSVRINLHREFKTEAKKILG